MKCEFFHLGLSAILFIYLFDDSCTLPLLPSLFVRIILAVVGAESGLCHIMLCLFTFAPFCASERQHINIVATIIQYKKKSLRKLIVIESHGKFVLLL